MIISLSGKKQSGKSTVAKYLHLHKMYWEYSWAHPLKEIIGRQLFGLTTDQLYGNEKEVLIPKWNMSARQILQIVGTDCFRKQIADDIWIKLGVEKIKEAMYKGTYNQLKGPVISDTRFVNEADAVRNLGGITILVKRIDQISTDIHESETALDNYKFDHIIEAKSGDINALYNQVNTILKE